MSPKSFFPFSKMMKMRYNLNPLLQNRVVLYFFFILALLQMVYFMNTRDITSLVTLLIVGFLTTFFSKNMIVVICIALAVTNVLKYGTNSMQVHEGFDDVDSENKKKEEKKDESEENSVTSETGEKQESMKNKKEGQENMSKATDEEYEKLKKEYPEFKEVQKEILSGVEKMAPLIKKAETFIDKFSSYKKGKNASD